MNRSGLEGASTKPNGSMLTESKLQDVGCCGDVPKNSFKSNKRDKLLEWLKSSQLKRDENNRQVFSRWIDQVDNGSIDLMSMSKYPVKAISKLNCTDNTEISAPSTDSLNSINTNQSSSCQNFLPPLGNTSYYPSNCYSNPAQTGAIYTPIQMSNQPNLNIYQPNYQPYLSPANSQIMNNYCQYVSLPQYPQYVMSHGNLLNESTNQNLQAPLNFSTINSNKIAPITQLNGMNIEVNKWFDILNEIKVDRNDDHITTSISNNN